MKRVHSNRLALLVFISVSIHVKAQQANEDMVVKKAVAEVKADAARQFGQLNNRFLQARQRKDSAEVEIVVKQLRQLKKEEHIQLINIAAKYPESEESLHVLRMLAEKPDGNCNTLLNAWGKLSDELKRSDRGKALAASLKEKSQQSLDARLAPEIAQPDTARVMVKLSQYRGKYVLVDFWASWCKPCRAENPNLLKAYNRFHPKGLEVLAVSLDNKKEAWLKAIQEDGVPWQHISDLKGAKNDAVIAYGVGGIPDNFLIDPDGVIIARHLRGETLEKRLEAVFEK